MSTIRGQHLLGKSLGSCVLEKLLGYGGSSAVFLARQHTPERSVAVKVFLPRSGADLRAREDFYQRFLREAKAASGLDHPAILPIYSYGEENGLAYIVMPHMPGGTLYEYLGKHGVLSLDEARHYLEQIAAALDYAHTHGCVHCDVKPANILLDGEGRAVLSDFGIARVMQDAEEAYSRSDEAADSLMGTPDYISPEQALGQDLDGRSDVYSLGVSLFYLLTGRPPFSADSTLAMALLHVHEPPPSLCALRADIPPQVDRVLRRALAKFPEERFATAGQFSQAFAEAVLLAESDGQIIKRQRSFGEILVPGLRRTGQPMGRVMPGWLYTLGMPRAIVFSVLLVLVMLGASFMAGAITLRLTRGTGAPQTAAGPVLSSDALANRLTYGENDWPRSSTFFFSNGQYHILNTSAQDIALALYANHSFSDFHLLVTTSQVSGSHDDADYYGVVFRADADQSRYYLFEVVGWGEGQYEFLRYDGQWKTLAAGPAPSLLLGKGQANTITVDAHGSTFNFFVNGQRVGAPVLDTSKAALTSGVIGLYVEEQGTEVAFSQLRVTLAK